MESVQELSVRASPVGMLLLKGAEGYNALFSFDKDHYPAWLEGNYRNFIIFFRIVVLCNRVVEKYYVLYTIRVIRYKQ